jgi:chromosome segregation ATPase
MVRCFLLLALTAAAFGQSADAVLTKTLIDEIRALRQNLESTTITSQRVQIVLYRLQSQTALVNSAQQRLDSIRTRLTELTSERKQTTVEIEAADERGRNIQNPAEKKDVEQRIGMLKSRVEALTADEAQRRTAEAEAASQLRTEQDKLAGLQSTLERLDKVLDELAQPKR